MPVKLRTFLACLLLWSAALLASAQEMKCDVCGKPLHGKYYILEDHSAGGKKNVCKECSDLEERCFACGLPVRALGRRLADGRLLCPQDAKEAVTTEAEARQICDQVRDDINRLYSRFLTLPGDSVVLSIVDRFHLESLFKSPGYEHSCVSIFGATQSQPLPGHHFVHSISLLSDLKKARLMAVCAHEYTHAWMGEFVRAERRAALSPDTVEGFCELVACKYMESRNETFEVQNIKKSDYTRGQIAVLLEAESRYGFNTVLEWIKFGEDTKLELDAIDRVRAVQGAPLALAAPPPALVLAPPSAPAPGPATLQLKGISGTSRRRFALINDGTFEVMEKGRVRLGQTSVVIRCLEIRNDSVVVQAEGSPARQELFLRNSN